MLALPLLLIACTRPAAGPLDGPADVITDVHGIPHIFASTEHDAYWLQGWTAASQRLFQMDLTRRRAQGRRAELLGEEKYTSDVQSRALRFAWWGEQTAAALQAEDPRAYAILQAYSDGVNAFLDDAVAGVDGASLPEQVLAYDYVPDRWTPADCMAIEKLITAGLSMRPDQEVTLGLLNTLVGPDLFHDLFVYEPFDADVTAPGWLDRAASEGLLDPPAGVRRRSGAPSYPAEAELAAALRGADLKPVARQLAELNLSFGGSNNWAVDAAHSATGHAMVYGDSHQGVAHPATYWLVHLNTRDAGGTLDAAGANFPGTPLVMFGHNGKIGWTPTTSLLDVSDVWLETWADGGREAVMHDGVAVPVEWRDEDVLVRTDTGLETRTWELGVVPHHGPLLPADALGLPIPITASISWTGYQARSTMNTYLDLADATDVDEALAAFDGYFTGGMNWLIGDVNGDVAWTAATDLPRRQQIDRASPPYVLLPGTGGYDWVAGEAAPYATQPAGAALWERDPADGFYATANNDPVGQTLDGDPFDDGVWLSAVFDIGTRSYQPRRRLTDALDAGPVPFELARDVQLDTTSRLAEVLLPYLFEAAAARPDLVDAAAAPLLDQLTAWDHRCEVDQTAPSIFHLWLIRLGYDMMADEAGGLVGDLVFQDTSYQLGLVVVKHLRHWLDRTAPELARIEAGLLPFPSRSGRNLFDDAGTPEVETRDALLLRALAEVTPEATRIFGDADPAAWRWGAWHQLGLVDGANALVPEASAAPQPKAGGLYTVNVGDFSWFVDGQIPDLLLVSNAPSNRFAFDLSPDGVVGQIALPGGQDERPGSLHHNDLLPAYLAGEYFDLAYRRADVEGVAEATRRWE